MTLSQEELGRIKNANETFEFRYRNFPAFGVLTNGAMQITYVGYFFKVQSVATLKP